MEILVINGHDYSAHIAQKGLGWKRNDLDSSNTGRTKDGLMRRDKIATKRTISFSLVNMTRAQLAELDDALSTATFQATYLDLHGQQTRTFYCSSFGATLEAAYDDEGQWGEATFNMIEV